MTPVSGQDELLETLMPVVEALHRLGVDHHIGGSIAPGALSLELSSSEDVMRAKLDWYRQGGEIWEQQWRDLQGVLRVQSSALDVAYLRRWAPELEVTDLLERALAEADLV